MDLTNLLYGHISFLNTHEMTQRFFVENHPHSLHGLCECKNHGLETSHHKSTWKNSTQFELNVHNGAPCWSQWILPRWLRGCRYPSQSNECEDKSLESFRTQGGLIRFFSQYLHQKIKTLFSMIFIGYKYLVDSN